MNKIKEFFTNLLATEKGFAILSWMATALIVTILLGGTLWWRSTQATSALVPVPTAAPDENPPDVALPSPSAALNGFTSIQRGLHIITTIPERARYDAIVYRISRGDSMYVLSEQYKVKSETILYNNKEMDDNPHSLKPGMELIIPPVDGIYYVWKDDDTFEKIAEEFNAKSEDIINFPGNKVDLTNPKIVAGENILIPGGSRELRDWTKDLQTRGVDRSNSGSTGTSDFGSNSCGGGSVANGYGWPADDHSISGNGYGPGHLGIDISAPEGSNVYAAGAGVVTMAQGGDNYGYGNVVQIDHGSGYVTVYAHLSQINVVPCQSVGQGTLIGYSGNTGNSFGAHLHFEVRVGGTNINPFDLVQ